MAGWQRGRQAGSWPAVPWDILSTVIIINSTLETILPSISTQLLLYFLLIHKQRRCKQTHNRHTWDIQSILGKTLNGKNKVVCSDMGPRWQKYLQNIPIHTKALFLMNAFKWCENGMQRQKSGDIEMLTINAMKWDTTGQKKKKKKTKYLWNRSHLFCKSE